METWKVGRVPLVKPVNYDVIAAQLQARLLGASAVT